MKRLTEKNKMARFGYKYLCGVDDFGEGIVKLGQLEDIEDELGIDLITLFKALRADELYIKTTKYGIKRTTFKSEGLKPDVSIVDGTWVISCCWHALDDWWELKDYGKTWALTKEELE